MNNVIKRSLLGLTLGLSMTGAQASTWVPIGGGSTLIFVPVAGLGDIQTDTFHYGNDATVVLNDVGDSSAVYYRVQNWVGDKASGGYDAAAQWQCVNKTQLAATNNTLTLTNIASGRYQITASAVMESGAEVCDVTAFNAGQFNHSDVTAPAEFLVINHTTLDNTDSSKSYMHRLDPTSYDLKFRWLPVTGSDSYQLNINKDSVDYPLTVDADTYGQANEFLVRDVYDPVTETYKPYSGFGYFNFSVQYQLNGQLSNPIVSTMGSSYQRPIPPTFIDADDYLSFSGLEENTVRLVWTADKRTPYFNIKERNYADASQVVGVYLTGRFPGSSTIIQKTTGGRERVYDHLLIKTEPNVYRNQYFIQACRTMACINAENSTLFYDPADLTRVEPVVTGISTALQFAKNMENWIVNPGQYAVVEEESGVYLSPNGLVANNNSSLITSAGESAGGGSPTSFRTPVVSDEILNRLEVNPEINAETTALLGEQIDLNTGSVSFTHTDVSLPGSSGLPVSISRTHKGGNYSFQNTLEFADWQLDIPSIQTTLLAGHSGFGGGWGKGTACSSDQRPAKSIKIRTDNYKPYEYFNGTTLSIPGVTNGKLLNANYATSGVGDPAQYRYLTKDNWRISCLTSSQTHSGGEGFKATSPQGVSYYFDRYRLVQGDSLTKDKHAPRYYAFMMVTKVEDRFGNFVTYNYNSNNQLTSIVGQDVGEATPRSINIAYSTEEDLTYRISSVTANNRTWTYGYLSDPYIDSTLVSVTRPDNSAWGYDLAEFSHAKVSQMGKLCLENADTGYASGSVTHPSGAKGEFNWIQVVHGRSQVDGLLDDSNRDPLVPSCFANISISTKKLTGPGLDDMLWTYQYSQNAGSYVGENKGQLSDTLPPHMAKVDHKWIKVNNPDGSKTKHYFNRSYTSVFDGLEVLTDYFDTDGATLLKREEKHYAQGGKNGAVELNTENMNPIQYRADLTKSVQTLYTAGVANSTYITENGVFNIYGKPTWTYGYNNVDTTKKQYTRSEYYYDTTQWVLDLPTTKEVSSDNSNWTLVSEQSYHSATALPYYESSFGQWIKRYVQYSNGNLTKVEFNEKMNDNNYRWQYFDNYKRGKAQTITLPERDDAAVTINATLVVDDNGWVKSATNFNGEQTGYTHDLMGRVETITPADTKWLPTNFTFEKVNSTDTNMTGVVSNMYKQVMSKGNFNSTTYFDGLYRPLLVKTTDTSSGISRYQRKAWNIYGKESFSAFPSTNASENQGMTHTFDGLQRPVKTTQTATGAEQIIAYLNGQKTKVTSYNGDETTTTYLAYGEPRSKQMIRTDSPEGVVTTQSYNVFGSVTAITQGGVTQSHFYNTRQQLCKVVRPDTGTTAYGKNIIGEIIWVATGASGSKTSCDAGNVLASEKTFYTHDNLGANKTVNYPDATSADLTYAYDNQGNLKTLTAGSVVQSYNYFSGGKLEDETLSVDGKSLTVDYGYNSSQALSSMTYPDNTVIDFAPNGFGEPTKAAGFATNAQYYPDGQVNSFTFGNGVNHVTTLNTSKMPSSITATKDLSSQNSFTVEEQTYTNALYNEADDTIASSSSGTSTTIMDYGYLYDNQGNITSQTDMVNSAYSITGMTYDGLERLTAANGYWGDVDIDYDTLGNIQHYNFTNSSNLPSSTLAYAYNDKNQLKSVSGSKNQTFEYDSRGNVTNNGKDAFDFNKAQQIMSAGGSTYVYDGHGRRVKRTLSDGTINYSLYSQSGKLLYREKDTQKVKYVFMGGLQVARVDAATQYIHTDLLGSAVVETNSAGSEIANSRMHYRPFGATVEAARDEVGYTGHKFDADIGLSYMQARYYDPEIGRFYSNDPVGFSNSHNFNRFTYANNNPYKYIDPDGKSAAMARKFWTIDSVVTGGAVKRWTGNFLASPVVRTAKIVLGTAAITACAVAEPCGAVAATMAGVGAVNVADGLMGESSVSYALHAGGVDLNTADAVAAGVDLIGGGKGQLDNLADVGKALVSDGAAKLGAKVVAGVTDMAIMQMEASENLDKLGNVISSPSSTTSQSTTAQSTQERGWLDM